MKIIVTTLFVIFSLLLTAQETSVKKQHFILKTDLLSHLNVYFPSMSVAGEWNFYKNYSLMTDVGIIYRGGLSSKKYSNQQGIRIKIEPRIYLGSKRYFYVTPGYHYLDAKMNLRYHYQVQSIQMDTTETGFPFEITTMQEEETNLTVKKMHHAAFMKFGFQKIFEKSGFVLDLTFGLGIRATRTTVDGKPTGKYFAPKEKNLIQIPIGEGWQNYPDINFSIRIGYRF